MTILASDRSICIGCQICWCMICSKTEKNMQKWYYHSCMLPDIIASIILWLVMNHGFSWIYHHIACGLCREITWSQSRDLIFKANNSCFWSCEIRAASMLSTDSQIISKWTTAIFWQIYSFDLNTQSFLEEGRRIRNDLWFISTIVQLT
jgi:hypothetical protein